MSFLWFVVLCLVAFGFGFWLTRLLQGSASQPVGWDDDWSTPKSLAPGQSHQQVQKPVTALNQDALDRQIRQLMAQGKQLDAIKLVRQQNDWSLQEARFYVQQIGRMGSAEGPTSKDLPVDVQNQVDQLIFEGQKIAAIKLVRETTGWSLRVAKEYVEDKS
jgi:ribosomal protein L7/L12